MAAAGCRSPGTSSAISLKCGLFLAESLIPSMLQIRFDFGGVSAIWVNFNGAASIQKLDLF